MISSRPHCGCGPRQRAAGLGTGGAGDERGWRPGAGVAGSSHERQEELLQAHLVGILAQEPRVPGTFPVPEANQSVSRRFRKQRKAVVSANDKKVPNGILEEQGTLQGRGGGGGGGGCREGLLGAVVRLLFATLNPFAFETWVSLYLV